MKLNNKLIIICYILNYFFVLKIYGSFPPRLILLDKLIGKRSNL
jgi:hypothetical protein